MDILVSVVITTYREGTFLKDTIESVLAQTYDNFEIVIVDNNADELTRQVAMSYAEKFPEKIRVVKETTQGVASARNKGIFESKGKYIALFDGDDLMRSDRLEKQLKAALDNPEAVLVSSSYDVFILENGKNDYFLKQRDIYLDWIDLLFKSQKDPYLNNFYVPLPSTIFFEREKIIDHGAFDPFYNGRYFEDVSFALCFYKIGEFIHLDECLVSYRAKKRNLKNKLTKHWFQRVERQERLVETIRNLYLDQPNMEFSRALNNVISIWLRENSLHYFSCRDGKNYGRNLLLRSLSLKPWTLETWKLLLKSYFPIKFYPKIFWFGEWESLPPEIDHAMFFKKFH